MTLRFDGHGPTRLGRGPLTPRSRAGRESPRNSWTRSAAIALPHGLVESAGVRSVSYSGRRLNAWTWRGRIAAQETILFCDACGTTAPWTYTSCGWRSGGGRSRAVPRRET